MPGARQGIRCAQCGKPAIKTEGRSMIKIDSPLPNTEAYRSGSCNILVSREEHKERDIIRFRWHLSISHQTRYPTWDEIKQARYELLPNDVTMAMLLPPKGQYVNLHNNCFHLHEIDTEEP